MLFSHLIIYPGERGVLFMFLHLYKKKVDIISLNKKTINFIDLDSVSDNL